MKVKGILSLCAKVAFSMIMLMPQNIWAESVNILQSGGWFESGYVTWSAVSDATDYNVYVSPVNSSTWSKLDKELVRKYPDYYRADAIGLKAGEYKFKVVPVKSDAELTSDATESSPFVAAAHDRSGFAHVGMPGGIGAYKNDGTLKDNAKVIYVWADNAKTVSTEVITSSKGSKTKAVGLQDIIYMYQKGYDSTPLSIRIIGTIKNANVDRFDSSAEGIQVKGRNEYAEMPITIEGVGDDAAIHGFGLLVRNCKDTEFRNFAIMLCMDDCLSLDTGNSNVWVHNMDLFYGNTGGDADQAKGDGTIDIKGKSKNCTISYNHFYDSGKCSLGGMKNETTDCWMTYHHNWFDHSDSRHPRIRTAFYHVYNNYFDGNSKYGVGVTSGGSAFVENNYFRNCKYPMLISKQGTDGEGAGTFSGENGGVIKACNNTIINPRKIQYNSGSMTDGKWDAVLVEDRNAEVSAVCLTGSTPYNSAADNAARTTYIENKMEDPSTVPATVMGELGAGRMHHGDFTWTYLNSVQDENYGVISELKNALISYKSTLVGFSDGTAISNGGAKKATTGGDRGSISEEMNNSFVPAWGIGTILLDGKIIQSGGGGSTPSDTPHVGDAVLGGNDYFWFNEANADKVNELISNGTITGGTFAPTQVIKGSDNTLYSDYTGSIRLGSNESITFHLEEGISQIDIYASGNGSMSWQYSCSNDGTSFTNLGSKVDAAKGQHPTLIAMPSNSAKYIRLTNLGSGNRDVQGVKLYKQGEGSGDNDEDFNDDGGDNNEDTPDDPSDDPDQPGDNPDQPGNDPDQPGDDTPEQPTVGTFEICHFLDKKPSSTMISVSGNYSDSKGAVTYDNKEYGMCVKMESATSITIKPTFNCSVTLVFDTPSKRIKLDGATVSTDANGQYTFDATANKSYTLTKGDTMNLFLVIFNPKETDTSIDTLSSAPSIKYVYTLSGQRANINTKGIIIVDGKKIINK